MEKQENKQELVLRELMPSLLDRNLKCMKMMKWPAEKVEQILKSEEKKIKIDPNIIIGGVKNPTICIYCGFSTRKLYDAMARKKKVIKYVVILEEDMGVFKHVIATEDLSDIICNPDVDMLIGEKIDDSLVPAMFQQLVKPTSDKMASRTVFLEGREIVFDPFQKYTKEYSEKVVEVLNRVSTQIKLSMGCPDDQFNRWELMIKNSKHMEEAWNFEGLYGKFENVPAIVLGGGPSLDDFIKSYKSNPGLANSIIIAADAVLHKLLNNNIRPHIVTRCERKLTNIFKGITREMTKGIYYAPYPWTPPEFFDLFEDYTYLFRHNGVCVFTGLHHAFVDGGVSASNAALELAIDLGCKTIFLAGVDLCFINDKSHTEGTQVEFNIEKSRDKWFKVANNSGTTSTTIPVWERCKQEYAQSIDKHTRKEKKFKVINTSKLGAKIEFTEAGTFEDNLEYFKNDNNVIKMIDDNKTKISKEHISQYREKVKQSALKFKEWLSDVEIADGLAEDAKKTALNEIEKLFNKCVSMADDKYTTIMSLRQNQPNFEKLWDNVRDMWDNNFRNKLFSQQLFSDTIIDVLQLNMYYYQNNCFKTFNLIDHQDERMFNYHKFNKDFTTDVKYYLDKFYKLFNSMDA